MPALEWSGPAPLATRQRTLFWIVALVCALSRFASMARSLWDWDEALFALGVREYDVTLHHPHPPGFPLYIGAAKLLRLVIDSDFRALQALNLLAGALVFPAMFLLARELRMRFEAAIVAAALFAFFPNVWFFGGSAFSDVPSIVLVILAAAFLFRGARSRRDYFIGTLLLALAIGIRPQNLLVGLFPGIVATWKRGWRDALAALLIGVAVVGVSYGAAIRATGSYESYMTSVRAHADYISRIDSFRSPARPPLWRIFDRFFLKQYQSSLLSVITSLFVFVSVIGAVRSRDRGMLANFLTFAPFALMAWLMLDRYSISRFSIGYAPMFAIFAADGIERVSRGRTQVLAALGALLIGAFIVWAAPSFTAVRNEVAPSVRGVEAAVQRIDPSTSPRSFRWCARSTIEASRWRPLRTRGCSRR
jgi:4-amino-4-deoxy-L-arabinose transferase-like glycosyltransferase